MKMSDKLNQFEGEIEVSRRLPFCWVVNPPNMKTTDIKKINPPYGVFVPAEQAEAAQLNATSAFEPTEITFGEEENTKVGFLVKKIRCCILHRSPLYVQALSPNGGWAYAGIAYQKGQITELGIKARDEQGYRLRSNYLLCFLDGSNKLLNSIPIKLTLGKGPGAGISNEVTSFRKEIERVFFKLKGLPEQRLSDRAHALCVLDLELGFHKSEGHAPFVCPIKRLAPAIDQVGKKKKVARREREVELEGVDINSLIVAKDSEEGQKILQLWEEYKDYFSGLATPPTQEQPLPESEFGEDDIDDDSF
jgi:hypothetical protein